MQHLSTASQRNLDNPSRRRIRIRLASAALPRYLYTGQYWADCGGSTGRDVVFGGASEVLFDSIVFPY
ncbi:MAG: hypothetical protein ACLR23_20640 [Clostridia bacterium]